MLLTTLGFLALTVLFARHHLRSSRSVGEARCPRCKTALAPGTAICTRCGLPLQAYEVVSASVSTDGAGGGGGALHAVVRADVCVGCGACVPACPEDGAIHLEGKLAVVNTSRCVGHGRCVEACPVGGIVLGSGASVHRVEVPQVGEGFESNVPGIYVVGELGGRGLIKNAINEGKIAAEHAAEAIGRRTARTPGSEDSPGEDRLYDVAVVGSGPAGLSAGLELHRRGLDYLVLEQGTLADTIRKYPRHKLLLAEPIRVPLYGDLWVADASKESLLKAWETIIQSTGLRVHTEHRVSGVSRLPGGGFLITTSQQSFRARRIILAMGRRGTPRRLGAPGESAGKVLYDIVEMEQFQGQRVLVVGGGDSAVESALGLANQPGTTVQLSYRGDEFKRVKPRNMQKLEAAIEAGKLELMLRSNVREILAGSVRLEMQGDIRELPNDFVIIRIGGEAPFRFLEKLGIRIVKKDVPLQPASPETEPHAVPH